MLGYFAQNSSCNSLPWNDASALSCLESSKDTRHPGGALRKPVNACFTHYLLDTVQRAPNTPSLSPQLRSVSSADRSTALPPFLLSCRRPQSRPRADLWFLIPLRSLLPPDLGPASQRTWVVPFQISPYDFSF